MHCAELQAYFVVCKKADKKLRSKCGNKLPQGWTGRTAWLWCSSPALELCIYFFCASILHLAGAREKKMKAMYRCLWHGPVLKMWECSCAVLSLTSRSCRGSQLLLLKVFWLMKRIDLKYLSFSFSGKFKEKMCLHIFRRRGDGGEEWDDCKSADGC